ncbi:BMC domain-containing protein [Niameybacter massiliensis]|uniref:BMC domain-containing protein n=1 Tax=Holtiella tumoricola TaxID=3018743 RepID=A0AA42J239_9FIRM|nr:MULTISPECIES: BMC domain-containing protein [Lachnospirales]MDA3733055.1 BMC domain-containing protein [Holtiella tumoricola]
MRTEALGLIEVIGYPTAIEAADSALKAANVKLASITKVDGGIMTVQILGDVGAVQAAVQAGGMAAARVGMVRATHVIPRVEASLFDTVLKFKTIPQVPEGQISLSEKGMQKDNTTITKTQTLSDEEVKIILPPKMPTSKEVEIDDLAEDEIEKKTPKVVEERIIGLEAKSNSELRALVVEKGIDIPAKKLNATKKQDLISILSDYYQREEGEV